MRDIRRLLSEYRYLAGGIAAMLALFILYTLYWNMSAGGIEKGLLRWVESQKQQGFDVHYGSVKMGGFPFRYSFEVRDFSYRDPTHPNDWGWKTDRLRLAAYVFDTGRVLVDASGPHTFEYIENLGPEARAPDHYRVAGTIQSAHAGVTHSHGEVEEIDVDLRNVNLERTGDFSGPLPFTAGRLQFHARLTPKDLADHPGGDIDVYITGDNVDVPIRHDLEPQPEHITGALFDLRLDDFKQVADAKTTWQDWAIAGGTVKLNKVVLQSDNYDLDAKGTLSVDGERRLKGDIDVTVGKHNRTVDHLVERGLVPAQYANTIKTVLNVLALTDSSGNGRVTAPLRFTDGKVRLGPASIASLRPLF